MQEICFLDDSYTEGGTVTAIAGYFAPKDRWRDFESLAGEVYSDFDVALLHTTDLHHRKRQFKDWPSKKCEGFVDALFQAAKHCEIAGISFNVTKSLAKSFNASSKKNAQHSALGMGFGMLMASVIENDGLLSLRNPNNCRFVIEKGNKNNAGIARQFNQMAGENPNQVDRSLDFVGKHDCKAIQLADFWAFYSRRFATKAIQRKFQCDEGGVGFIDKICAGAFASCPHSITIQHGGASSPIGEPNIIQAGASERYYFGPSTA